MLDKTTRDGYTAYQNKVLPENNPYEEFSENWCKWEDGYNIAVSIEYQALQLNDVIKAKRHNEGQNNERIRENLLAITRNTSNRKS